MENIIQQLQPHMHWIVMGLNGLIAGWLAGLLVGGGGLIRNLIVGLIGAFVGGALVNLGYLQLPAAVTSITRRYSVWDPDSCVDDRRNSRCSHCALPWRSWLSHPKGSYLSERAAVGLPVAHNLPIRLHLSGRRASGLRHSGSVFMRLGSIVVLGSPYHIE